jgi:hypothetical protein
MNRLRFIARQGGKYKNIDVLNIGGVRIPLVTVATLAGVGFAHLIQTKPQHNSIISPSPPSPDFPRSVHHKTVLEVSNDAALDFSQKNPGLHLNHPIVVHK